MKKIIAVFIAMLMPFAVSANDIRVLGDADASLYQQIFQLQDKEKISAAQKLQSQLEDDLLLNEVLYQRFFSDSYKTRGQEVADWMNKYNDMPGAVRMQKLGNVKKVAVKKPNLPTSISGGGGAIETPQSENWTAKKYSGSTDKKINEFKRAIRSGSTKVAREILESRSFRRKLTESDYGRLAGRLAYIYYTNGETELAKKWGFVSSDADSEYGLWTMGLIYFKEENYEESQKYFSQILELKHINNARKIEAAFWAGRAADFNGRHDMARQYWSVAANFPMAFYGALSATMLGGVPQYEFFEQDCTQDDIDELRQTKYGKRALALLQVGRKDRAEEYMKLLITSKASDRQLHAVNSVATAYGLPRVSVQAASVIQDRGILEIDDDIIYSAQYPVPDWEPMGGWSIDRALLFAITKQESGFRTTAKSGAGANGVMQLMPSTAKRVAKQNNLDISQMDMSNPEHNMYLGQQYIVDLLAHPNIENNIIKMLAAYNAGMGTLTKFEKTFYTYDPLLYIESFPAYETRNYIKRVMANLWLYRARLNQPLTSLQELAGANWPLYNSEDEYVQQQIADRMTI
ncbi:MAG: lytic transglycosylase domain-containing protein [Alphaproteobacteria bacterium]|nr:lytic transglycosylase domain-containing protein [Alphaproteobacteria bacterium]MBR5575188.1 lytic transglycosylase domain-containing protein [Alphaproteobacteria bacterium]